MVKNIGTPALSQIMHHFSHYKCFFSFVCIGGGGGGGRRKKKKKRKKKKPNLPSFYTELQKWTGQNYCLNMNLSMNLIFGSTPFGKNN